MEFIGFRIREYKGIQDVTVDLERSGKSHVNTLVGLNESGKTTILEAVSAMGGKPFDLKIEDPSAYTLSDHHYHSLIPVSKRYNFNGHIELTARFRFSKKDKDEIKTFIEENLPYHVVEIQDTFSIQRKFTFKDSKKTTQSNTWNLIPKVKIKKKGSRKTITLNTSSGKTIKDHWLKLAEFVEPLTPEFLYFRNEVFDIPDRILISEPEPIEEASEEDILEEIKEQKPVNKFYCDVIQDILHSIDENLRLEDHITKRKRSSDLSDAKSLAGLLQKMGQHITQNVMRQWETIFSRKLEDKRIQVSCELDLNKNVYILLKLEDGGEIFDINERSTGFRWYFAFILITYFRVFRKSAAVFLYDEPASNLHSSAQKQLLRCFSKLPENIKVLYSTHSHYLINPEWLDCTYIAKNEAVSYTDDNLNSKKAKTDINLIPYRQFTAQHPNSASYFQPVLDVLKCVPSDLETIQSALLCEGKRDFYALRYLIRICLKLKAHFDIVPVMGASTADELIALYAGWGKKFAVLLDADSAGQKEKNRYIDKFGGLVTNVVITYSDIEASWIGFGIERIIDKADISLIQHSVFPNTEYKKETFHLAVQELLIEEKPLPISAATTNRIKNIVGHIEKLLK